jgi:hypothetical protein
MPFEHSVIFEGSGVFFADNLPQFVCRSIQYLGRGVRIGKRNFLETDFEEKLDKYVK